MSSNKDQISHALLELAESGCQGNLHDFRVWLLADYNIEISDQELSDLLQKLVADMKLKNHDSIPSEYLHKDIPAFNNNVSYEIPSDLQYSPIQWVRSRLESFLSYHQVRRAEIIDISIATTEAMENAVKYSTEKKLRVFYRIKDDHFDIKIENEIKEIVPEADIKSGKYTGSLTLMRGMMVMVKLMDQVNIDIEESENMAIFTALHKLNRTA